MGRSDERLVLRVDQGGGLPVRRVNQVDLALQAAGARVMDDFQNGRGGRRDGRCGDGRGDRRRYCQCDQDGGIGEHEFPVRFVTPLWSLTR